MPGAVQRSHTVTCRQPRCESPTHMLWEQAAEPAAHLTNKHVGRVLVRIQMDGGRTWTFPQQPKASAYGGMGLARESVFIDMKDEQFQGKFEKVCPEPRHRRELRKLTQSISRLTVCCGVVKKVYQQHIDFGSTGKAFIKGFKREREANMLWHAHIPTSQPARLIAAPVP